MKTLLITILCITNLMAIAQQKKLPNLKVGNQFFINPCPINKPEFIGIEIYSRNEIYDKSSVDSLTGNGLSKAFFNTKNLDGKRLPCSMGGRSYTIAALDTFTEKGITHQLVFLYDYYPLNLLLVDLQNAIFNKEVVLAIQPKKIVKKKKI